MPHDLPGGLPAESRPLFLYFLRVADADAEEVEVPQDLNDGCLGSAEGSPDAFHVPVQEVKVGAEDWNQNEVSGVRA
ncbi:hypothetical protein AB0N07_49950 [Streptomyces sp. NPDC051172]|uniref:hypothetical protein n=1 Tax=Streptomyces sp. NPDC051172 TaxID=3155796 RepID=UPI003418C84D